MPNIESHITSFGYGHGPAPTATITIDTRLVLRDPHVDPALRALTGLDRRVADRVRATPGAAGLIDQVADVASALLVTAGRATGWRVDVAVGCVGGRHRSVAIAEAVGVLLAAAGHGVVVEHRDVHRPLLAR